MSTLRFICLLICVLSVGSCATRDEIREDIRHQYFEGKIFRNSVTVGTSRVPLATGEWLVLGSGSSVNNANAVFVSLLLAEITETKFGKEINRAVLINTNSDHFRSTGRGWDDKTCRRRNVYFIKITSNDYNNQNCWWVSHSSFSKPNESKELQEMLERARRYTKREKILWPLNAITTYHRFANRATLLSTYYFFNPDLAGIAQTTKSGWTESDWHVTRVKRFPKKVSYLKKIKRWGQSWHAKVKNGFDVL